MPGLKSGSKVKDIITDTGLYVFNKYAGYELKDIADKSGVRLLSHTLPLELNNSELQDTLTAGSEIIVYGKIPAMVSSTRTTGFFFSFGSSCDAALPSKLPSSIISRYILCTYAAENTSNVSKIVHNSPNSHPAPYGTGTVRCSIYSESSSALPWFAAFLHYQAEHLRYEVQ